MPEDVPVEIRDLAERRAAARRSRDWAAADALRDELLAAGWKAVDSGTMYDLERAAPPDVDEGGVMRYGILNRPPHFDVHQSGTVGNIGTQGCMFDNLIRRDPRDSGKSIVPDLAHS